jgi:hypothetical protein
MDGPLANRFTNGGTVLYKGMFSSFTNCFRKFLRGKHGVYLELWNPRKRPSQSESGRNPQLDNRGRIRFLDYQLEVNGVLNGVLKAVNCSTLRCIYISVLLLAHSVPQQ